MGCERFEEALWEAAEGQISPSLAEHLGKCPACRQELQTRQEMQTGLAVLRTVNAPEARAAVRARLTFCAVTGLLVMHAVRGRPPTTKPPPVVARKLPPPPVPAVALASEGSARTIRQGKQEAREVRLQAVRRVVSGKRRVKQARLPRAPKLAHPRSAAPAVQVNPVSEISDIAVTPVIVDSSTQPSRHYPVMVPGRTDPVKQYTIMLPGRTDPVRQYATVNPRRYDPMQEPRVVLDPTYRRRPQQREVIVLSDPEQMPLSLEIEDY
jgi:hypothetical protein